MSDKQAAETWIPDVDLPPESNIWGREWKTPDGKRRGTYWGQMPTGMFIMDVMWRFPRSIDAE